MKQLCYLGILKEGLSAYSSSVMLISRKVTQDNRVLTDFRHLNVRIDKNNSAYPLLKYTFLILGSSRCEVLSVFDLKDAFLSLRLSENSTRKPKGLKLSRSNFFQFLKQYTNRKD